MMQLIYGTAKLHVDIAIPVEEAETPPSKPAETPPSKPEMSVDEMAWRMKFYRQRMFVQWQLQGRFLEPTDGEQQPSPTGT